VGYGNEKVLNPEWIQWFIMLCKNSGGTNGGGYNNVRRKKKE